MPCRDNKNYLIFGYLDSFHCLVFRHNSAKSNIVCAVLDILDNLSRITYDDLDLHGRMQCFELTEKWREYKITGNGTCRYEQVADYFFTQLIHILQHDDVLILNFTGERKKPFTGFGDSEFLLFTVDKPDSQVLFKFLYLKRYRRLAYSKLLPYF